MWIRVYFKGKVYGANRIGPSNEYNPCVRSPVLGTFFSVRKPGWTCFSVSEVPHHSLSLLSGSIMANEFAHRLTAELKDLLPTTAGKSVLAVVNEIEK